MIGLEIVGYLLIVFGVVSLVFHFGRRMGRQEAHLEMLSKKSVD